MIWNANLNRVLAIVSVALGLCATAQSAPKYKVLHYFNGSDGSGPYGGVILDQKGNLYGTTAGGGAGDCRGGCGTVFELTPQANGKWTETVLYSFNYDSGRDGAGPWAGVTFDASGNLYGTTVSGGTHDSGIVFELAHKASVWEETVIYDFCARQNCSDGGSPQAALVVDQAGTLYGTAYLAFELSHGPGGWNETVLHTFGVKKNDGTGPYAGLILDAAGNVYGTTRYGGTGCGADGCGTVYELSPTSGGGWRELVLHRFDNNGTDGVNPGGGPLLTDSSGSLYGTTTGGGTGLCGGGVPDNPDGPRAVRPLGEDIGNCGTVFKLTKGGDGRWKETIPYDFKGGASGYWPGVGVVMDKAGNLYGTAALGGRGSGCGVIYKLAPKPKGKWKYTVLYAFYGGDDGCVPAGNLVLDSKGNLYGGTVLGGVTGNGVIFELTP